MTDMDGAKVGPGIYKRYFAIQALPDDEKGPAMMKLGCAACFQASFGFIGIGVNLAEQSPNTS